MRVAAITAFSLLILGTATQASAASGNAVGPGCDPSRPAVAYHAGSFMGAATPASSHHGDLPIPCAVVSDSTIDSAPVAVTRDGTVVSAPENTVATDEPAVTVSRDNGATWHVRMPTLQTGTLSTALWMNADPQTNRIWLAPMGPLASTCDPSLNSLAEVTWSDDEGRTWHSPPADPTDCRQLQGGQSIVEGPAPKGQPQPTNYPHVVYECGQVSDGAIPLSVHCWKSLDGGETWSFVAGPNNPPSDCTGKFGGRGKAVGRDGTLYMAIECVPASAGATTGGPGPLYLASSRDEGNTWNYQFVTNTSYYNTDAVLLVTSLAVDQANNLYIAWVDNQNHPLLIVGNGSKWGNVLNIAQPGVTYSTRVSVTVDSPGHVALAYVGSPGGIDGGFNGYITESGDALSEDPTFIGAPVNDPLHPLMSSAYAEAITARAGRIWTLTPVFGPDGTPWAAFHCANMTNGTTTGVPAAAITCPNGAAPPAAPLALGVVGRLTRPHGN